MSGQMRGGMDPVEMGRRSAEARRAKAAVPTDLAAMSPEELASLGDETLRRVMVSSRAAESAKVQAAKEWNRRQALVPDVEFDWRRSVQVRPDYEPPTLRDLAEFAARIGVV